LVDYNIKIMKHQGTWEVRKWYSIQFNSFSIRWNTLDGQLGPKHVRKESIQISFAELHRDGNNIIMCKVSNTYNSYDFLGIEVYSSEILEAISHATQCHILEDFHF
jgi:hypothetical protein